MNRLIELWERWRSTREMERKGQIGSRKRRTDSSFLKQADQSRVLAVFLLTFLWVAVFVFMALASSAKIAPDWSQYKFAPHNVINELGGDFEFVDAAAHERAIAEAAGRAPVYFSVDGEAQDRIIGQFRAYLAAMADRNGGGVKTLSASEEVMNDFLMIPEAEEEFLNKVDKLLQTGIVDEDVLSGYSAETDFRIGYDSGIRRDRLAGSVQKPSAAAGELADYVIAISGKTDLPPPVRQELTEDFLNFIGSGNLRFDRQRTEMAKAEICGEIPPVTGIFAKGSSILCAGEKLDDSLRDIYRQYAGQYNAQKRDRTGEFIGMGLFAMLLVIFMTLFLYHLYPEVLASNRLLMLLVSVLVVSLGINFSYIVISRNVSGDFGVPLEYFFSIVPVPLAAMLLAVTMGLRISMGGGFLVAVVTAQMMDMELRQALLALVVCTLSSLAVRRAANYRSLFLRCFGMFVAYWILDGDALKMLPSHSEALGGTWRVLAVAASSSVSAAMLVLPLVFLFELVFNVSTNMSLLVMCDLNHPLLRQLQLRAPGTSMHSQNVAILAEAAAEAIGANPLRARAAALYHDIGKLVNPEYFTENNIDTANMHTALTPRMSSIIILNHVKDGLDLAIKYKLCRVIRNAIAQHHGTDLLHFFKAASNQDAENVSQPVEMDFRYPGPLPRDPEIVLVSLADACEAYCRSLQKPTPSKIEAVVREIFQSRLINGQLDAAEMTAAELARARDSMVRTLTTMYHTRIAYRKEDENDSDVQLEKSPDAPSGEGPADPHVQESR